MQASLIDRISAASVKAALRDIRYAKAPDSPLLGLHLVQQRLQKEGVADSPGNRTWMLGRCLDEAIRQRLAELRGAESPAQPERPDPQAELAAIQADFRLGKLDLEAWSMLFVRYLGLSQLPGKALADQLGITTKTITRRLDRGHQQLAELLSDAELEAQQQADRLRGVAVPDRIHTPAAQPDRHPLPPAAGPSGSAAPAAGQASSRTAEADQALHDLLRAVRSEDRVLRLSKAQAAALEAHRPDTLSEMQLCRIAEWSRPRYRLDSRFVGLTLLVDQGERVIAGRWQAQDHRYTGLGELLQAVDAPALVLLGPPGSGKSTLLRRLELDTAIQALRLEPTRICCLQSLAQFRPSRPGGPHPAPGEWLAERWAASAEQIEPLDSLLKQGRMLLLLDALNEIPAASPSELAATIRLWKDWLQDLVAAHPGNRIVFACRSLDYSQPLSSPSLRVPQIRIEGLTDAQVQRFLQCYRPAQADALWQALSGSPQLELLRSPYFLKLLVEQVDAAGEIPAGRAALFTGFVRQALRRELELGNPRFEAGDLLTERDRLQLTRWRWKHAWHLPERGRLLPSLARLAESMQANSAEGERSQVRLDQDRALDLIDAPDAESILRAGEALALLDEDPAADEVMFVHQLIQEYFAARAFIRRPDFDRLRQSWRSDPAAPELEALIDSLDPADPLPPLPLTGWEETLCMAASMTEDPDDFLLRVMDANPSLAGQAAAAPELRRRLSDELLQRLGQSLIARSRDPEIDLRERIACGLALGQLGDPRLLGDPQGPDDSAAAPLLPSTVEITQGEYSIGGDAPIEWTGGSSQSHMPRHSLRLARFTIARMAVSNAEWDRFMRAGGYEDPRWWDRPVGQAWRRGENSAAGLHAGVRHWLATFRAQPQLLAEFYDSGAWDETILERWRKRLEYSEAEFEAHLAELYPGGPLREPRFWRDPRFNAPAQPVVGICWHEARAYCNWLSASQTLGRRFRLPSEVEWEAAARGQAGRRYAWGDGFEGFLCNGVESHLRRTAPGGVFPDSDTPEGLSDMTGNVWEWTASAWGHQVEQPDFGYPYTPTDGREAPDTDADLRRVVRGGAWTDDAGNLQAAFREGLHATSRDANLGLRLVEIVD